MERPQLTSGLLRPLEPKEAFMKHPLVLAYIGDTVYDLYMRTEAVRQSDANVNALNRTVCAKVNARAQAQTVDKLLPLLQEEEKEVYRRGRNAKSGTVPKNMEIGDYHKATGLEAVVGYLFLIGAYDRLEQLFTSILDESGE